MALSQKYYAAIAEIIKDNSWTEEDRINKDAFLADLSRYFQKDNPCFNRRLFENAARGR